MPTIGRSVVKEIEEASLVFERNIDYLHRKQTGSYYTSMDLTTVLMQELVAKLPKSKKDHLYALKFLEPSVGTGNYVFAYLAAAQELNFSKQNYKDLFENIYVCDINEMALAHYRNMLSYIADTQFGIYLSEDYFKKHIGHGVIFDVDRSDPRYISIDDVFGKGSELSFDIIATNPPYKNLKAEQPHYALQEGHDEDKKRYSQITAIATRNFKYSTYGVLNLYKLFVEEILERYPTKEAFISLLIPSSILTDKTCERIRNRILETSSLLSIRTIPETNHFIDATQSLTAILIKKGIEEIPIEVTVDYGEINEEKMVVSKKDMIESNSEHMFLVLQSGEIEKLKKMNKFPKIKDLDFIINMRGELDLTANKSAITLKKTQYPLLRGRNIGFYELTDEPIVEFVNDDFVENSSKRKYVKDKRIVCQQISNMKKKRRLTFAPVPGDFVLANSCNFITIQENDYDVDEIFLLGILNSRILNWYFKLQSSNNHINNYEIDNFPIPINYPNKKELTSLVKLFIKDKTNSRLVDEIDALVEEMYFGKKIEPKTQFDQLVKSKIEEKNIKISRNVVLNHTTFKLSELDMEMIQSVPQGGNWKNIPDKTVQKSKRLIRIKQTGGRTTLYGRIDYSKPSYTITTYFNRPGNGTYVHPSHDRVLSVREAARLQSFPDSYYFCGNKTQVLKQVGNAVPPILAYQIGKRIKEIAGCNKSLDLFSGAGGMTLGFKLAGIKSVLSNDIDTSACLTLKVNNPEIEVISGDITDRAITDAIVDLAQGVDVVSGGPPCQGFSMAGFRLDDDPRNKLFLNFIDIVSKIKPKVVVFENVEGLLTYQEGRTYSIIHSMFEELGYNAEGRILLSSLFAVPQRRKRVFIVCTRNDLPFTPIDLFPNEITYDETSQITAYDAIFDLQEIKCSEDAVYESEPTSSFARWARCLLSIEDYISTVSVKNQNVYHPYPPINRKGLRSNTKVIREQIPLFEELFQQTSLDIDD